VTARGIGVRCAGQVRAPRLFEGLRCQRVSDRARSNPAQFVSSKRTIELERAEPKEIDADKSIE
jgi:hypothetical protein